MAKRKAQPQVAAAGPSVAAKSDSPPSSGAATPMMEQYLEIKAANADCLLFYRMGDFYELFFDDAEEASRALGIALTTRGKHLGQDIPMCGVPVHTADEYLQKLIALGYRVAVCEQMEDPAEARKRGSRAVVRREVVRLVTPGTLTEEALLDSRANNFLTALFRAPTSTTRPGEVFALASLDISTGEFLLGETPGPDLPGELVRLAPGEIIAGEELAGEPEIRAAAETAGAALTPVPRLYFDSLAGGRALKEKLNVAVIEGLGDFSRAELATAGALLKYVDLTQIGRRPLLRAPRRSGPQSVLVIDAATRANLELTRSIQGERRGSLLRAIDRTVTGAGARELAARLASPLADAEAISHRLEAVGFLLERQSVRADVRRALKGAPDIARALARLVFGRGSPRDLGALRDGLAVAENCAASLAGETGMTALPGELEGVRARLHADTGALAGELDAALGGNLPAHKRDGGFVRQGYNADLDENRMLRDESRKIIAGFQAKYAEATGIKALKVRHNNVLGYFIEVPAAHGQKLMQDDSGGDFIHRQTLANAVRFTTAELGETEAKIIAAADRALAIESEIFDRLADLAAQAESQIGEIAGGLAVFDHYCALAELAEEQNYERPLVDDGQAFHVEGGRHPVVEQALGKGDAGPFVENDCSLGEGTGEGDAPGATNERIWIVTGPNMAGKSTFLRQNALIVILAQMGSYVPARTARIGVVDRLFSRVGASDDLAGGRSTFMVEMVETARILNQATERSFVILDEIGRGTATFDGLSIAWACVEHLHAINRARALFATHYHEMTALAHTLEGAGNVTMEVKEWKDEIVFLHKVVPGAADRSYGIHVAKLAGLPDAVITRAQEVLNQLENSERSGAARAIAADLPLFSAAAERPHRPARQPGSAVEDFLARVNPDEFSPKQALEALYDLKRLLSDGGERA